MKKANADGTRPLEDHRWSWRHLVWRAFVERLKRSDAPILVGPWRGEIGFEALYWTSFVERVVERYGIDKKRLIPISRGGAAAWYGCTQGIELFAMRSPQQMRVQMRLEVTTTGRFKQATYNDFDRAIIRDAAETLNLKRYHVLHPAWMYHNLARFWTGHAGIEWVGKRLNFRVLDTPALPQGVTLPPQFVTARFYARPTFPAQHKLVNQFVGATLEELSSKYDVVLLDHDLFLDDHMDLTGGARGHRIHHLKDLAPLTPETNLAVASAVLGRSLGFIGTYGGFGQLALRMAKPSVSYFLEWGHFTSVAHRNLADVLSIRSGIPAMVLKLNELAMLQAVMPIVTATMPKPSQFTVAKDQAGA